MSANVESTSLETQPRREGPRRITGGIVAAVSLGLTIGALCLVVLLAAATIVIPVATGSQTYTILTRSMEPTFPPGSLIVVRPAPPDGPKVGDVITFQPKSGDTTVVTHRIVKRTISSNGDRSFTTKGDNNAVADANPVRTPQIRGVVWYAVPWVGALATWRSQGALGTLVPIVGIILLLWAGFLIVSWLRERIRRNRNSSADATRKL
ncbi:signal peptidase I [Diaminobutyricibacter sp. McL0618]|uniref:signal peptidase I n=1 Tax=Leifsonia sp. McL0618 TaxID=3415677 RepID=UPI003CEE1106